MLTFYLLSVFFVSVCLADDLWSEQGYNCESQENEIGNLKVEVKSLKGELDRVRQQLQNKTGTRQPAQKKGLISKGKRVYMSSVHDYYLADHVLDGDLQTIAHTGNGDSYIVVALLGTFHVNTVTVILSNAHGKDHSLPLNIHARLFNNDWMMCGTINAAPVMGKAYNVSCRGMLASYVRMSRQGYLILGEVEIYGEPVYMGHELLSRGKPATQSSTHSLFSASVAVDGKINSAFSHTMNDNPSWWQVNLQAEYRVYTVRIFYIQVCPPCGARFNSMQVLTQSSEGDWFFCGRLNEPGGAVMGGIYEINCKGVIASQVRIQLTAVDYLHFTEVEVYGKQL